MESQPVKASQMGELCIVELAAPQGGATSQ